MKTFLLIVCGLWALQSHAQTLTLSDAVVGALARDTGGEALQMKAQAARAEAVAARQLPDPRLSLGANNLPVDTFALDQEPMTQLSVGVSQQFPAGDTLALRGDIQELAGSALSAGAELRRLQVVLATRRAWYEALYWQQAAEIYRRDQSLFEQLLTISRSLFSVGKRQQQDVLRAELELSHLRDRLITADERLAAAQAALSRWVGEMALDATLPGAVPRLPAPAALPDDPNLLADQLRDHPRLEQLAREVAQAEKAVALAEQQYRPEWGVDLRYGYRDGEDIDGGSRADFFSAMVSVELPLFTDKRQDQQLAARRAQFAGERARELDTLREHVSEVRAEYRRWQRLIQRRELYEGTVLAQSRAQAEAALKAYQSDAADFDEVMRARLAEQRSQLDYQRLLSDEQQTLARLHYLLGIDRNLEEAAR